MADLVRKPASEQLFFTPIKQLPDRSPNFAVLSGSAPAGKAERCIVRIAWHTQRGDAPGDPVGRGRWTAHKRMDSEAGHLILNEMSKTESEAEITSEIKRYNALARSGALLQDWPAKDPQTPISR